MPVRTNDDTLYAALLARDRSYEGFAYVGVKTTRIFCRLSCPARKPKRANVDFFPDAQAALAAGFRACKRCRPLEERPPVSCVVPALIELVRADPTRRWSAQALRALSYDPSTVQRAFLKEFGRTFLQYARDQRLGAAFAGAGTVLDAQLDAGYESPSGFREAVRRALGDTPSRARNQRPLTARWIDTPIGAMLAIAGREGLYLLEFADRQALPTEIRKLRERTGPVLFGTSPLLETLAQQLGEYFAGTRTAFDIPIAPCGSAFQQAVWTALRAIPPGETRSYRQQAEALGKPQAVRAVARANGANQIAILIPCHRVIGADGALTGYGGRLWRKAWLLEQERRMGR